MKGKHWYIVVDDHNADNRRAIWGSCPRYEEWPFNSSKMVNDAREAGYANVRAYKIRRKSWAYGVRRAS